MNLIMFLKQFLAVTENNTLKEDIFVNINNALYSLFTIFKTPVLQMAYA